MPPSSRPVRKPPSRYHHGDLRRALLEEAVRTIGRSGVAGLTLREAGRRVGVSRTALYRHFSNKSALLAAVATDGFQRFRKELLEAWEQGGRTRRGFDAMGLVYVRFALANPAHYRVMFGDFRDQCSRNPQLEADAGAAFQVLVDAIVSLQETGAIRRDDPQALAQFIWAIVHGVAMLAIDGQLGQDPGAAETLMEYAHTRIAGGIDA